MLQDKIHKIPVSNTLMATSSSTTFGGPPSPLEKAIRKTAISHPHPNVHSQLFIFLFLSFSRKIPQQNSLNGGNFFKTLRFFPY